MALHRRNLGYLAPRPNTARHRKPRHRIKVVSGHGAGYRPALDGLRALAVSAVIAFHLGLPWASGGFLGVDLFFVISGFLITGLLFRELGENSGLGLRAFYARRARRLLPALFTVLVAVALFALTHRGAPGTAGLRGDVAGTLTYVANWRFIFSGQGYFAQFTAKSPLIHTWSLAIEEQYYLLWPIILLFVWRLSRCSRRWMLATTVALGAASATAMAVLFHPDADISRIYYGTDTRAFELLMGSGLALAMAGRPEFGKAGRRLLHLAGAVSLVALVVAFFKVTDSTPWMYRGGFVGVSLLGAALVASATRAEPGPLGAALSWGPLPWVGRLSYGLYLWHWPVIDLLTHQQTGLTGPSLMIMQVGVALAGATASYYLIERPVRSGRLTSAMVWAAVPATVAALTATVLVATTVPSRPALAALGGRGVGNTPIQLAGTNGSDPPGGAAGATSAASDEVPPLTLARTRIPTPADPLRVMIVGDSVMYDSSPGIVAALQATGVVRVTTQAIFGFGLSRKNYDWHAEWPRLINRFHPDLVVAMFGGWDGPVALDRGYDWYNALLAEALATLQGGGASVLFLQYPQTHPLEFAGVPAPNHKAQELGRGLVNRAFTEQAQAHPTTVAFLPTAPVLEVDGRYAELLPDLNGQVVRARKRDGVHVCPPGSALLGRQVLDALKTPLDLPPADPTWRFGTWRADGRFDTPHGTCAP